MVKIKTIIIFLITFFSCTFIPQKTKKNSNSKLYKTSSQIENKGNFTTSAGKLKVLFIFAKFKDDTVKSNGWKLEDKGLQDWATKIVNSDTEINFPSQNLTQYYYEMSNGNFFLYGNVYPKLVIPDLRQKEYKSIADVNSEILTKLDKEIDFSKYDNWSKGKDKKYVNKPDGKVDVIFIVYRNFIDKLFFNNGWTGIAHLYLHEDMKTNDGVTIKRGRLDAGSGIEVRGVKNGFTYIKYVLAHEFGHFLFGSGHIENTTNLTLMAGGPVWNACRGMSAWEREYLDWMKFKDVSINENSEIWLDDYFTTNSALRIKLKNNEWFIIENHQKISRNDWAGDKGVYIYKLKYANRYPPAMKVECADGNWNFRIDKKRQEVIRTIPNPNGKSEMDFSRNLKGKSYACSIETYEDNSAWGDQFDAFDLTYNNLFSPVSNPSSQNQTKKNFAIQVLKKEGNKYLLKFVFKNVYEETPPAKPQIIGIEEKDFQNILLTWLNNKEPDMEGYNLYQFDSSRNKLGKFAEVNLNKDKKDAEFNLHSLLKSKIANYKIAITAIDQDGRESVLSNFAEIKFNPSNNKWHCKIKEKN